jgi:hypothetical protein
MEPKRAYQGYSLFQGKAWHKLRARTGVGFPGLAGSTGMADPTRRAAVTGRAYRGCRFPAIYRRNLLVKIERIRHNHGIATAPGPGRT